jgi:poly(A) polymerase
MTDYQDPENLAAPIRVLSGSEHCLTRSDIDPDALRILYRLQRNGFIAYLCGGAVRDLLMGRKPKDFDIATDARPGQIRKRFANVYIIGRRFRLAHVHFPGGKIIEVATFRRDLSAAEESEPPAEITPELLYGSPREDAFRRDVSINALYYDDRSGEIIDYVGGLKDLAERRVRIIGDPGPRFEEDAVRIWRVVRYAARLGFEIEDRTARAIPEFAPRLGACAGSRLYEELNKEFAGPTRTVLEALHSHRLLRHILGRFGEEFETDDELFGRTLGLMEIKDRAWAEGCEMTREEMYALFFWPWAETVFAGEAGDLHAVLDRAFDQAKTQAVFPKKMRMDIIQILILIAQMRKALRSGRMRWSLKKRAHFEPAFRVFHMIEYGCPAPKEKTFDSLMGREIPPSSEMAAPPPVKRHSRRRRRPRRPE